MSSVFISHVVADGALAAQIAQGLEAAGYTTWYYERDSLPGPSYLDQILAALDASAAVVVLLSPAALASWQVDKEVVQAHERGLPFVPLLHGLRYEEMHAARPAWAMAFGAAVALPLPEGDSAAALPQIVAGLRWLAAERGAQAGTPLAPEAALAGRPAAPPRFDTLPVPPTPLLGRDQAVAQLAALLSQPAVRLLTMTGPGGVGKTRLAIAVAQALGGTPAGRAAVTDGVCFVDLAPLTHPALVAPTIAHALGVREEGGTPLAETLRAALRERAVLLLLDNCEQVIAAAPEVAALLAACPRLRVLATSRAALHLRGEHEVAVPPLGVPDPAHLPDRDALARVPAVALFVARAQEARAGFALSGANAGAVAAICARLDGLPLAIELAAARVKLLAPPALLDRLGNRLALLTGGARDLPERQRTLRATLDWSYDLLQPEEQTLFARLSVFQGGRTLEAIEAVCNHDGTLDTLAGVEALLANSLLTRDDAPRDAATGQPAGAGGATDEAGDGEGATDEARLTMLETLHAYARERLEERGETGALRRAHAGYVLALAERAAPRLSGPRQAAWLARLQRDHDNVRAALAWAVEEAARERGDGAGAAQQIGLRLATALWRFWEVRGHLSEGRRWLESMLDVSGAAPADLRAAALQGAGALAERQGDEARATALLEECIRLRRLGSDQAAIAAALNSLAGVLLAQGELERALALLEESLALRRATGEKASIATALSNLGTVAHYLGDNERATSWFEESLALRRAAGDTRGIVISLLNLGVMACVAGATERAAPLLAEALTRNRALGDTGLSINCLEELAGIAALHAEPERAARLFAAAEAARERLALPLLPGERPRYDRLVASARAGLDAAAWRHVWAAGAALTLEQATAVALREAETPTGAATATEPDADA